MTLEEIVTSYAPQRKGRPCGILVRCENTGETGTVPYFAARVAAARKSNQRTECAKLYRSITLCTPYRGLRFTTVGAVAQDAG